MPIFQIHLDYVGDQDPDRDEEVDVDYASSSAPVVRTSTTMPGLPVYPALPEWISYTRSIARGGPKILG
ncbi:hypothetical protein [Nocardia sp. NPDC049707]|uniref:hypothetical protein n=1 Tax=Nocardia sp. NPDC049707 TaxID=3154735 RepID=UPI00343C4F3A